MLLILSLFLLFLSFVGYNYYRNIIAPAVIAPGVWGGVLFLYATLDHRLDVLSYKVLGVILLWNLFMLSGIWIFGRMNVFRISNRKFLNKPSNAITKIYGWISIIGVLMLLYTAYKQGTTMSGDFFFNLRMANTGIGETDYKYGIFEYTFAFAYVFLLILINQYHKNESNIWLKTLVIINIIMITITMAKSSVLFLIVGVGSVIMLKHKIAVSKILFGLLIVMVLMSTIQLMRADNKDGSEVLVDMFYTYTLGGVPALDQIVSHNTHALFRGQKTWSFFDHVLEKLGLAEPKEEKFVNDIFDNGGYLYVPLPTNVYTVIGPFWLDYKYFGVIFFGFIMGALSGLFYRLAIRKNPVGQVVYAYLACVLLLQFFGEYIFVNLSYTIQVFLLTFLAYRFNFRIKWHKSTSSWQPIMENDL